MVSDFVFYLFDVQPKNIMLKMAKGKEKSIVSQGFSLRDKNHLES